MKIENHETKQNLIKRLRRIQGQLGGIQAMLEDERDCREIMQQLSAVSAALKSTSRSFFQDYASLCLAELGEGQVSAHEDESQHLLQEMLALLDKTP